MSLEQEVQTEAEELASMMAGYNKARGDEPPVEVAQEPSTEQTEQEAEPAQQPVDAPPAIEEQPKLKVEDLAEELKALKAKVSSSAGEPDAIRKMHGEIGNINRTLKQLQTPAAPDSNELSAALKDAEAVAEEYPELAGPLVKALKAAIAADKPRAQPVDAVDFGEKIAQAVIERKRADDIEALADSHPDYREIYASEEFKKWLSAKPAAYQEKLNSTWNPAIASKGLDEFKESRKAQERNKNRLAAAVAPQGMQQRAQPSTLPDEAGFAAGYSKHRKRS